jgi:acyl transferase domain-containing protein/acyl carrier protein/NAD(P)-dependent dehydrogenase (short-subunit alcohol dehydrogenase family)
LLLRQTVAGLLDLQVDAVQDDLSFREQGMSSAQVLTLVASVSERLNRAVPLAAAWEHPTIADLSAHLGANPSAPRSSVPANAPQMDEPIAIVGMGCRFPGGIHDPSTFWQALLEGVDAVREVPPDRWDLAKWFDTDPHAPGKMSTRWGGFIEDVAGFDAGFFQISPKEAVHMDPQQRLALEVSWEALEDAGIVPETLDGSRTGVFVGAWGQDYAELAAAADSQQIEQHSATGRNNSVIPARIAYSLGLRGPVLTVNTACSSSLVAVHLAVQSLRSGESELALVSGVNLMLAPHTTVQMTKFGAMSPTGRCRSFADEADGYVRGEGCGAVVLRRLSDALRNGERIYAVIRGSAINNDGASNGLAAPNPEAQREVLAEAWRQAGLPVHEVSYVEAHGTGTPLGDPIEASALAATFGEGRTEPLRIGSIKTNFGHLEGAAGMAGLMKTALALHHGELPASLHFKTPSARIPFAEWKLKVVDTRESFPGEALRTAGVSSFGYGGTNGHLALSELPARRRVLVPLAADTAEQLAQLAQQGSAQLAGTNAARALAPLLAPNAAVRMRVVAKGRHPGTLVSALETLADSAHVRALSPAPERPRVVFVFSGHGSQWLGMGRELLASEPTFARVLRECDRFIQAESGWSVISELCARDDGSRLGCTAVVQPILYALQVALARMLQSWGIKPDALLGQSIGEVAAAVIGGALSEQDGAKLIVRWSLLVERKASGQGAMVVAALTREQAEAWLERAGTLGIVPTDLSLSAQLAPQGVSFAGTKDAISVLELAMRAASVRVHAVSIDYACHSQLMRPLVSELTDLLCDLRPGPLQVPLWSTVHARFVQGEELDAAYWAANLERPIALQQGIEALCSDATHFIDVGPHPITLHSIEDTLSCARSSAVALATGFRAQPVWPVLEELVTTLWQRGVALDWQAFAGRALATSLSPSDVCPEPYEPHALPLLLSARTEPALRAQAGRWASWLEQHPETPWADVLHTAALHRTHFPQRAAITAADGVEAAVALRALCEGRAHAQVLEGPAGRPAGAVFVFPGQGSQWRGMGRALLVESSVFAQVAEACDAALRPHTGWSVLAVLRGEQGGDAPASERVDVIQPALFTMNVALAAVWRSFGVQPSAVVGHSQGEIAAAVVAGALSLEDGARIVALRSKLLARIAGSGAMATTELPLTVVEQRLKDERWSELCVAVVNTETSTVVAGTSERVEAWLKALNDEGVFCRRVAVNYASHTPHVEAILEELRQALCTLSPRTSDIAMISTVTGKPISGLALDADYWCRNLREPVRLDLALAHLRTSQCNVFIEASAHPVLSMALNTAEGAPGAVVGSLRREAGGLSVLYANLAALHVAGFAIDCARLASSGQLAALPTYAFQHQSYWLPRAASRSDLKAAGLSSVKHPFLASLTSLAETERLLLTGRVCLGEQPWLSHHAVFGTVVAPGTCLLELSLSAARAVGSASVSELTLAAPLLLPEQQAVRLQIHVEAPDARGARALAIFSRSESASEDQPWTQHATGALLSEASADASASEETWLPPTAQALDLSDAYKNLAEVGYDYGESFQCLRAAWRVGAEIFAHVALPASLAGQATDYCVHPALLDAALHAVLIADMIGEGSSLLWLPFSWSEVSQHAVGATELHVRFVRPAQQDDTRQFSLSATDTRGQLVLTAGALRFRQASAEQIRGSARNASRDLYRVSFRLATPNDLASRFSVLGSSRGLADALGVQCHSDVQALLATLDEQIPATLVVDLTGSAETPTSTVSENGAELTALVQQATARVLSDLRQLLSEPRLGSTSLVWVTRCALAAGAEDDAVLDLVTAPVWGLIRSARSEHPERSLRLIDLDHELPTSRMFKRLVATTSEPELALRDGDVLVPRLTRVRATGERKRPDYWGTVLITGGLGELGRALALHLVEQLGAKHLVLTSRRGMATPGAHALITALERAGAKTVTVVACNVAVRDELEAVIDAIPLTHPLCAVFHLAGVLSDGLVGALSEEQLRVVLAPKVEGALHLHELTQAHPVSTFVMFSSVASVLGFQGQANYAAANAFLDALASERRRIGLPAQSLAWGFWEPQGIGMSAHLGKADIARMARQGVGPLPLQTGFALLESALSLPDATLTTARLDLSAFSQGDAVPVMLRALVHRAPGAVATTQRAGEASILARLLALPEAERQDALSSAVRDESASVLGLSPFEVSVDQPLRSQGLDSLMAVELKNRLTRRFEITLPTTLAFDYPTTNAIVTLLHEKLKLDQAPKWSDADIRGKLERLSIDALRSSGVLDVLMLQPERGPPERSSVIARKAEDVDVDTLERDSLLDMMERMLGDV